MTEVRFPRLIVDGAEGTRFDTVRITVSPKHFATPAVPFGVSPLKPATQCGFLHLPAGSVGEQHPSPIRM